MQSIWQIPHTLPHTQGKIHDSIGVDAKPMGQKSFTHLALMRSAGHISDTYGENP